MDRDRPCFAGSLVLRAGACQVATTPAAPAVTRASFGGRLSLVEGNPSHDQTLQPGGLSVVMRMF